MGLIHRHGDVLERQGHSMYYSSGRRKKEREVHGWQNEVAYRGLDIQKQ